MIMNPLHMILAVLPALAISFLIYKIDKYDREPHLNLFICFIIGMLITYPAMQLEGLEIATQLDGRMELWAVLLSSFVVVALSEELFKFLALILYAFPRKAFNEPLDGIVYSVMIAMGFATVENVIYAERFGMQTIIVRAFTAVPAHAIFAIFMGYYVGMAKFDKARRIQLVLMGLLWAVIVHGTYDFFIIQEYYEWLIILATVTLLISLFFAIKLTRIHRDNSPFRNTATQDSASKKEPTTSSSAIDSSELSKTEDEIISMMNKEDGQATSRDDS